MNTEALFLFLILLLGLILCSFLGGNCGTEAFTGNSQMTGVSGLGLKNNSNSSTTSNGGTSSSTTSSTTSSGTGYDNYNHFNGSTTVLSNDSIRDDSLCLLNNSLYLSAM